MSDKKTRDNPFDPNFWLAAGFGSAMLASRMTLSMMRSLSDAGAPARTMMKGPFGGPGWAFGPLGFPTPAPEAASSKPVAAGAEAATSAAKSAEPAPVEATSAEEVAEMIESTLAATLEAAEKAAAAMTEMAAGSVEPGDRRDEATEVLVAEDTKEEAPALAAMLEPETQPDPAEPATADAEVQLEAEPATEPAEAVEEAEAVEAAEPARPTALDAPRGDADDLKRIKGVGPKLEGVLNGLGYFHYDQIAAWGPDELKAVDESIGGTFAGRATRDDWIGQAKDLASGGTVH